MISQNLRHLSPKDNELDIALASAWVRFTHAEPRSEEYKALFWAFERIVYLTHHLPQRAWRVILLIWSIDHSDKVMVNLSAGPIEDLLAHHGPDIISAVEAQAKNDHTFARLLGGVWKNGMAIEVWERLQKVWDRRGWDGIPG